MEKLGEKEIRLVLQEESDFPAVLREIPFPPLGLYIKGSHPAALERSLAIVGTRRAGSYGRSWTKKFATDIARKKFSIVSGLSFGIDASAAEGALAGSGHTVAVLANSLDTVYPQSHASLAADILANGGCLISETPIGVPALPFRFLQRNRIVSGLCRGVCIVEAPLRSGSMATARFAGEQNRDIFVLPGLATDANYEGSHQLIREGAQLITEAKDVLRAWGEETGENEARADDILEPDDPCQAAVLRAIRGYPEGVDIDKILEVSKLSIQDASRAITYLLLQNAIRENEKGYCLA